MKFSIGGFALFFALISINALGQATNDAEDVVKITTKLVQVDVVVTDKTGQQVRDLKPTDFELTQDGKRQQITAVTFVSPTTFKNSAVMNDLSNARNKGKHSAAAASRNASATGRVIAFLIDDGACSATVHP